MYSVAYSVTTFCIYLDINMNYLFQSETVFMNSLNQISTSWNKIHKMVFMIKLLFRIVRAITLFALCGFAVFLTFEIFLQFQSKDSSFKKSQVPISTLPSISICFDPKNKNLLEYGKDFNISKYNNNNDYLGMAQFRSLTILKKLFLIGGF